MQKIEDKEYHWKGFGNGNGDWDSFCRLLIFDSDESTFVVVSDLGMDTGTSITNSAEHIATLVVRDYKLDPSKLTWIECYPGSDIELSLVSFTWQVQLLGLGRRYVGCQHIASSPVWRHLDSFDEASPGLAQAIALMSDGVKENV